MSVCWLEICRGLRFSSSFGGAAYLPCPLQVRLWRFWMLSAATAKITLNWLAVHWLSFYGFCSIMNSHWHFLFIQSLWRIKNTEDAVSPLNLICFDGNVNCIFVSMNHASFWLMRCPLLLIDFHDWRDNRLSLVLDRWWRRVGRSDLCADLSFIYKLFYIKLHLIQ